MSDDDKVLAGGDSDLLDQSTIDALMAEARADEGEIVFKPTGERYQDHEKVIVETYDFRNPVFLTELELRQVRIRHEQFIHYLGARLSMFLRMDFGLKMSKLYTAQYSKFIQSLPNPAYISLYKVDQFPGVGVTCMNPRLAMTITDRMLGGKGHSVRGERYLTEIECSLMDDVVLIVLEEWCRQWEDTVDINATPIGTESNGRFLQTAPHDAIILVLCMEGLLGDCSEEIQIGIPYYTIEPVIKQMQQNNRRFNKLSPTERNMQWRPAYAQIDVPAMAEWEAFDASVRDLLALREGDILQLPKDIIKQTRVRIVDEIKFVGEVGLDDDHVAVKITEGLNG